MEGNVFADYGTVPSLRDRTADSNEWARDSKVRSLQFNSCSSLDNFARSLGSSSSHRTRKRPPFEKYQVTVKLHPMITVNVFISQVRSGPVRAIYELKADPFRVIMLLFFSEYHAQLFRLQVQSFSCVVAGHNPTEVNYRAYLSPTSAVVKQASKQLEVYARRTLELSRAVVPHMAKSVLSVECAFQPGQLMHIFAALGDVLEVRPMFRQNAISFAIDFSAADNALQAKRIFDFEREEWTCGRNISAEIFIGLHEWKLNFAKDNTERDGSGWN